MKNNSILIVCFILFYNSFKAQSLPEFLKIAEENSSELQSLTYTYQTALEKVNEVGSLPNTTISAGYFLQEAETRVGAQKAKLSASQMLPWFGTFNAKKESAAFNAKAQLNTVELAKRTLFLNVKSAYYSLLELNQKKAVLNENIILLKTFERIALRELENNKATFVDVLKIQIEQNELDNKLNTLVTTFESKKRTFNILLNRNENTAISLNDSIMLNADLYNKLELNDNPQLLALENKQLAVAKMEISNKKESLPSIGVGLDYIFVDNRPVDHLSDNGKDIIMPMVSVSVPLFSKKYSSKQKQLLLTKKAIESSKTTKQNELNSQFETALNMLTNSKASIEMLNNNIEKTQKAQNVLLKSYQVGKINFEQLLEIQQLQLQFQLKKIETEKEYALQKAQLEFLTSNN